MRSRSPVLGLIAGAAAAASMGVAAGTVEPSATKGRMRRRDGQPMANLSRNHPDYGCTPAEHARRKAERKA